MAKNAKHQPEISLAKAFLSLKTQDEVNRFLADVCTPAEIEALAQRWAVAQLLHERELSYRDINTVSGASITTVTRVARFMFQEKHHGYRLVLKRTGAKD